MQFVNVAAYKFVSINEREMLQAKLQSLCDQQALMGSILVAPEGINIFLAGTREAIDIFKHEIAQDARFSDLEYKESFSDYVPFRRMRVKLKQEIITMKMPVIKPEAGRAPSVDAKTLKRWLDQGHDDAGKEVVMLDTRNDFEVDAGTFHNAVEYRLKSFSEFPQAIADHRADFENKTIVSFCTGGIRCEKAAIYMQNIGLENTLQLEGGILKYFEEVGGEHWDGACFVFDQRVALDPNLSETDVTTCEVCHAKVSKQERHSVRYVEGKCCPHCFDEKKHAWVLKARANHPDIIHSDAT